MEKTEQKENKQVGLQNQIQI